MDSIRRLAEKYSSFDTGDPITRSLLALHCRYAVGLEAYEGDVTFVPSWLKCLRYAIVKIGNTYLS